MLFRPSLPWGFAAGSGSILGDCAACHRIAGAGAAAAAARKQEAVATIKSFFSIGFRRVEGAGAAAAGGNRRKK